MAKEFDEEVIHFLNRNIFGKGRTVESPKTRDFSKYKQLKIKKEAGINTALFFSKGQLKLIHKILMPRKAFFGHLNPEDP